MFFKELLGMICSIQLRLKMKQRKRFPKLLLPSLTSNLMLINLITQDGKRGLSIFYDALTADKKCVGDVKNPEFFVELLGRNFGIESYVRDPILSEGLSNARYLFLEDLVPCLLMGKVENHELLYYYTKSFLTPGFYRKVISPLVFPKFHISPGIPPCLVCDK